MDIVLDAMGGDYAPAVIVQGAAQAVAEFDTNIVLVGRASVIEAELNKLPSRRNLSILDAPDVIEMGEHPARAVRAGKQSSIVVGMNHVRDNGGAFVSAGNSGATMAAALLNLGRIPGIERPGLATVFPTLTSQVVLIDVGANTDSKPTWLQQFAIMGSLYAQLVLGVERPRVGLLSNGEEESKGNELVQQTIPLIRATGLNFVGNVEGRDIPIGKADVIVMDGFDGNVVIKTAEGVAEYVMAALRQELTSSPVNKAIASLLRPAFRRLARRMDYAEYGGAPLLGVKGLAIVAHGRSDARAIKSAIRVAKQAIERDLVGAIAARVTHVERSSP